MIPAANGGFFYIKANSIASMMVGTTVTTVFAKASITLFGGDCETTCAIDGNVFLRVDVKNTGEIDDTVQLPKTSVLFYSND